MNTTEITIKNVDPIRVARLSGVSGGTDHEEVGPLTQQLFGRLMGAIQQQQIAMVGPVVATYEPTPEGGLTVSACCPVGPGTTSVDGLEVADLPGIERVAAYRHDGPMSAIGSAYAAVGRWIADEGASTDGTAREVYLISHPEPESNWRTEVQLPIT
jgi:effector-binding domain-containing protein